MGRPQLAVGTYGSITVAWAGREQKYKARARYRDADGVVRPVARFGKTKGAAERSLKDALRDRQRTGGHGITSDTIVAELADEWIRRIELSDLAIGTKQQYRRTLEANVRPALGSLRVGEVRVSIADNALQTINRRHGYSVAKTARAVMSGMFGLAVRQDALPANPVRDAEKLTRGRGNGRKPPRALTVDQDERLIDATRTSQRATDLDLADLAEFMLMTGCRIGEALACRTAHNRDGEPLLDLAAGTWEINATVVRVLGVRRRQALEAKQDLLREDEQAELDRLRLLPPGMYVQEHPKSEAGWRVIALPSAAVALIRRRIIEERPQPHEFATVDTDGRVRGDRKSMLLFPSPGARSLRDPNNAEGDLRQVLDQIDCSVCGGTGYQLNDDGSFALNAKHRRIRCAAGPLSWVTSHTFRKTVATRMEEAGCSAREVAEQLGHARVSMTQDVYFGRNVVVAAAAQILER